MMDEMKKIRKGQGGNMDFLENGGGKGESKGAVAGKRNAKDKKFGFGGKKRHLKKNDNSADDVSGFRPFNKGGAGGKFGGKPGVKGGKKVKGHNKRPGKGNRQKMKNDKNSADDVSGFRPFNKGGAGV